MSVCAVAPHGVVEGVTKGAREEEEADEEQPSGRISLCRLQETKKQGMTSIWRRREGPRDKEKRWGGGGGRQREEKGAETLAICRFAFCAVVNIKRGQR